MQAMQNVQDILEEALKKGQEYVERGECASYIPELARADKKKLGVCLYTQDQRISIRQEIQRIVLRSRVSPR